VKDLISGGKQDIMKKCFITIAAVIAVLSFPAASLAHGARIGYKTGTAVEITAEYDSGDPMSGAQVIVYAPDNPSEPWLSGVCDENGRFVFVPDISKSGIWDVQVRFAGHGDIIHIPVDENIKQSGSTGFSGMQIALMTACVAWGFIGTALFFLRRKNNAHS